MLALSLLWLGLGALVGALGLGARLRPAQWTRHGRLGMLATGALAGLVGGWLGMATFGRLYGMPTALWVAVMGAVLAPRALVWLWARRREGNTA